jgi:hypothetical protein
MTLQTVAELEAKIAELKKQQQQETESQNEELRRKNEEIRIAKKKDELNAFCEGFESGLKALLLPLKATFEKSDAKSPAIGRNYTVTDGELSFVFYARAEHISTGRHFGKSKLGISVSREDTFSSKKFYRKANGEYSSGLAANFILAGLSSKKKAEEKASLLRSRKPLVDELKKEFGIGQYSSAISESTQKESPIELKLRINRLCTEAEARAILSALKAAGIGIC